VYYDNHLWFLRLRELPATRKKLRNYGDHEAVLSMRFKKNEKDDHLLFTLGLPINVIKAIDSAIPYKKD